jgi:hypothetical protein
MSFILQGTTPVSGGGTGSTTLPLNNVLLGNGINPLQAVAPGTSGNLLTSNGTTWASTAPSSSSAMTLISKTVITGNPSSVIITSGISTTYTKYKIIFDGLYDNSGNSNQLTLQLYANGALDGNNCYGNCGYMLVSAGSYAYTSSSSTSIWLPASSSALDFAIAPAYSMYLEMNLDTIYNNSAGSYTIKALSQFQSSWYASPRLGLMGMVYQGSIGANSAVTGFGISGFSQFVGTINLYGIT